MNILEKVRILNNKEKYGLYDRDDFDYYGIRDKKIYLRRLVKKTIRNQYQEKVLLRIITNIMKAEGIKKKDYQ